jgi:hypothetical protein
VSPQLKSFFLFHRQLELVDLVIDCGCEDGRISVFASFVTISDPNTLSTSETGVNPRRKAEYSTYLNELVEKPFLVSAHKEV